MVFAQEIYEPGPNELEIQERCQQTLPHPENTVVALIEYEAINKSTTDCQLAYCLFYTNATDEDNYTESCDVLRVTDQTRPVIEIEESKTCHNVLFFVDGVNPVVCLYFIPSEAPTITIVPLGPIVTTFVVTSIAVVASIILLVTYLIFASLRTLPSKLIMNLALSFLLGDICVIVQAGMAMEMVEFSKIEIVGVVSFYFFIARFIWMALAGFEMCRTIYVGTKLHFDSENKRRRILVTYILVGWMTPLLPAIIMAVVHFENLEGKEFGESSLFGIGGYVITLAPVGIVIIFNIGIILFLSYVLLRARRWQLKVSNAIASHKRKSNFTRIFIIIISVLGLSWILLFVVYWDGVNDSNTVYIIYTILNASQPIFVCIAFVGTKKIIRKYLSLCSKKSDDLNVSTSTTRNQFRNRKLLSFLFTDKQLAESLPKFKFGQSNRNDSELSATSVSMISRDSSQSLNTSQPPPTSNGDCSSPTRDGLTTITEELEPENEEVAKHSTTNTEL